MPQGLAADRAGFGRAVRDHDDAWRPSIEGGVFALWEASGRCALPVTLVVPTTAQPQSLGDTIELIQLAKAHTEHLPVKKIIVALNEIEGKFLATTPGFGAIEELLREESGTPIRSFVLPRLHSEIWEAVQAYALPFRRLITMKPQEIEAVTGIPVMQAGRGRWLFMKWIEGAIQDLDKIGLVA